VLGFRPAKSTKTQRLVVYYHQVSS
jgi:hypothetical protein